MVETQLRSEKKILFVAAYGPESGTGHIRRVLRLMRELGSIAYLYNPDGQMTPLLKQLQEEVAIEQLCHNPHQMAPWDLIVMDNFKTDVERARLFMHLGRVVALDEGGEGRQYFPYLIDTLPTLPESGQPNEMSVSYLNLPEKRSPHAWPPRRILVSFGGSDVAKMTESIGQMLDSFALPSGSWTVVKGPLFQRTFAWPGVKILENVNVYSIVGDYDLVITHFGITAYEAAAAGANVVLLNPTLYHERLAQVAGLPSLGIKSPTSKMKEAFYRYITGAGERALFSHNIQLQPTKSLASRLQGLMGAKGGCPSCLGEELRFGRVVYRDINKSYAECPLCGLVYQEPFYNIKTDYSSEYFNEDYKKQYGKTYLEDIENIKNAARLRLKKILAKSSIAPRTILEIGCAYGAFLQVAQEQGLEVFGIEPNREACHYVQKNLNVAVSQGYYPQNNPYTQTFDIVALWYVIEHFPDIHQALQALQNTVKKGGILAFSTPLGDGLSAKTDANSFYLRSPSDHFVIFNRKHINKIMQRYGFKVVAIRTTGVHPERKFPKLGQDTHLFKVLKVLFTWLHWGDTFEVYAQKE